MSDTGTITVERDGRTYAATYAVEHGKVRVQTHTETRTVELRDDTPQGIAVAVLNEIIDAQGQH